MINGMQELNAIYANGINLKTWGNTNAPDEDLIYRSGVENQILKIGGVAAILPNYSQDEVYPPRIVGTQTSKSVGLPVSCFRFTPYNQVSAYCFIRDNFYNIKVVVISDSPIHIPYHVMYSELSPEKYADEVERYVGYTKKERPSDGSDEWYSKNWASGTIIRKDGRIYRAGSHQSVYCEGIDMRGLPEETFKVYEDGMMSFVCEVGSYATVAKILEHVIGSLEVERSKRNQERHAREVSIP